VSRIVEASLALIYDSRGTATVEATLRTESGAVGRAGAPSGASTGRHEVQALPTGGVPAALEQFRERVRPRLLTLDVQGQPEFDRSLHEVDGTPGFQTIGGNVATALSVACALARSDESGSPLWRSIGTVGTTSPIFPAIVGNCLNGGRHAIGGPDFQEFIAFSPDPDPRRSIRAALAVHRRIGEEIHRRWPDHALGRGDEGGWVAPAGNLEALEILSAACQAVTDELRIPVHPGLDLAASEFFDKGQYHYRDKTLDVDGQLRSLVDLVERFDLRYIEDPFQEEDFASFAAFTEAVGSRALVVGDDLFTTAEERVARGVRERSANSVLIKVNQVGTLTDTLTTVELARKSGWRTVTSHRSGDLPEGWLAQLAVGFGSAGLKCGLLGGERVAKLNELLRLAASTGI
jgi:enolase